MAKRNTKNKFNRGKKYKKPQAAPASKIAEDVVNQIKNTKKCFKAKEYLEMFENNKEQWKFNKMLQVFILNYILIKDIFAKKYFAIFKTYFLKMNQKTKTEYIEKCTKFVQSHQEGTLVLPGLADEKDKEKEIQFQDEEKKTKMMENFHKRCVDIIENTGSE